MNYKFFNKTDLEKLNEMMAKENFKQTIIRKGIKPKKIYEFAIDTYGSDAQIDVAIEEMSELIKELIKAKRGKHNLFNIAEEIADVEIMLEQLKLIFGLNDLNIAYYKVQKNTRLHARLMERIKYMFVPEIIKQSVLKNYGLEHDGPNKTVFMVDEFTTKNTVENDKKYD